MAAPKSNPPILTEQDIKRFWAKVNKAPGQGPNGDCWRWSTYVDRYGMFSYVVPDTHQHRSCKSHRVAFFILTGKWADLMVCHTCDWKPCCNPAHLFEGDSAANMKDASRKGRLNPPRGERQGRSKLTKAQVLEIRSIYSQQKRTLESIAEQFGVCYQMVHLIVNRKRWQHI